MVDGLFYKKCTLSIFDIFPSGEVASYIWNQVTFIYPYPSWGLEALTVLSKLVEVAGVEPASVSTLPLALHA